MSGPYFIFDGLILGHLNMNFIIFIWTQIDFGVATSKLAEPCGGEGVSWPTWLLQINNFSLCTNDFRCNIWLRSFTLTPITLVRTFKIISFKGEAILKLNLRVYWQRTWRGFTKSFYLVKRLGVTQKTFLTKTVNLMRSH